MWIIGGGKFGIKSARVLSRKNPGADITIVESNQEACARISRMNYRTVCMDGVLYLYENLKSSDYPEWIVPVVPVHLAYEWIKSKLSSRYRFLPIEAPKDLKKNLPNVITGKNGELYMSYADFICPDNCPEPDEICTYTGKPRLGILHEHLASIDYQNFYPIVIQSHQLSPGIGGYTPTALFNALEEVESTGTEILLATACKCHGVMHAFSIIKK